MSIALGGVFQQFISERPVCVMARAVLERILDTDRIDELFERTAQTQYTRELMFSSVVDLMGQVVLGIQPSVHAAWQTREEELGVSSTAVYDKLNHIEPNVSAELVRDSARQAAPVIKKLKAGLPAELWGYRTKYLDGNHLSATEHRIEELRTTWAAPLPGKALVVLNQDHMLASDVFLCEDGHAQERSLFLEVLERVESGDLWIADRNFCTIDFLAGIVLRHAFFVIRQHGQLTGTLVGRRTAKGRTDTGRVFEQKILITTANGQTLTLRRITVRLNEPTRDGDTEIHILTNLPVRAATAVKIAQLYRKRWTIETMFQVVTETLTCEFPSLGYPKAALFGFCLALMAYNAVSVIQAALRAAHGQETIEQVSGYYLSLEISQTYDGMMVAIPPRRWKIFRQMSAAEFARTMKRIAGRISLTRYRKHPRGPKKKPPKRSAYKNGSHVSTAKLIAARN